MFMNGYLLEDLLIMNRRGKKVRADLLIEDGKIAWIRRIGEDEEAEVFMEEGIDGSKKGRLPEAGRILLPGRIYEGDLRFCRYHPKRYRRFMRALVRHGYTAFIDTIDYDGFGDLTDEIRYVEALHADAPIDYGLRLRLPVHRITPRHLTIAARFGIKEFFLTLYETTGLMKIAWRRIEEARQYYDLSFWMEAPEKNILFSQKRIEERLNYWYDLSEFVGLTVLMDSKRESIEEDSPRYVYRREISRSLRLAKRAGLYPRKGSLLVGADADMLLLTQEEFQKGIYTPRILFLRGKKLTLLNDRFPFGRGRRLRGMRSYLEVNSFP